MVAPKPIVAETGLVLVQRPEAIDLCAVTVDAFGQRRLTSSDPEALPWPCMAPSVLGSVVAAIRQASGEILVGFPPLYDFRPPRTHVRSCRLEVREIERLNAEIAELSQSAAQAKRLYPAEARVLRSAALESLR